MFLAICCLLVTLLLFYTSKKMYKKWNFIFLNPLLVVPILIIVLLSISNVPYQTYALGTKYVTDLLGPATVAFAIPLYKYANIIKAHVVEIIGGTFIGSVVAALSSFVLAVFFHISASIVDSLLPRSVTTPIAMNISQMLGGIPPMTAVFVIITGLTGAMIGPILIRMFAIQTSLAKGLMLGMGAHGAGTSQAFHIGELEGTYASIGMIIASGNTMILSYTFLPYLQV
ncbi:LrgB family protein [Ectobacillus sp. sgz5001026]|uniref:LrgB family protein n=1 Tax=Ectobacillus sp. sgz5001026 TaxID=3242473 RepID=UPI0036D3D6CF